MLGQWALEEFRDLGLPLGTTPRLAVSVSDHVLPRIGSVGFVAGDVQRDALF